MASGSPERAPELTVGDHLRIAAEFLDFGARVSASGASPDAVTLGWAITSAYYAALHAISAYFLARHGERAGSHVERERLLRDPRFPEFSRQERAEFFNLKDASEDARYRGQPFTALHHTLYRQRAERLVAKWGDRARKTGG
jgi:hypothetical protein